jgi:hypothetical protein
VIVVDDGSTDNTQEIIGGFGTRIEYLAKRNGGKSSALNLGLRYATGSLIWIFDDDDIAEPDALSRLLNALEENPECGFSFGEYDLFTADESGKPQTSLVTIPRVEPNRLFIALMERSLIQQGAMLVRKSCYEEIGKFDETLIRSQDYDMLLRLAYRYQAVKVERIVFHMRRHSGIRGSAAAPIPADRAVEMWIQYDREILNRIYEVHNLQDFIPERSFDAEQPDEQRFTALLQRSCIMARKGLWDKAAGDLRQACELAQRSSKHSLNRSQREILRRVFDLFSFAPHTFAGAQEFRRALKELKPAQLRRRIRAELLWPLPLTIGAVLLHGQYRDFWRFLRYYCCLATPDAVLRTVLSRSFFYAGLQLLRARLIKNAPRWRCAVVQ